MTNAIQAAQSRRRRFNNQVLEDTLKAIQLSEKVIKDVLNDKENINSGCRKYGLDGNQMQYLLYGMRTILAAGERKVSRDELDQALADHGNPDCVERLYRSIFYNTIGAKKAIELMPADANETVEYICNHPSEFLLSKDEGKILWAVHLQGYGIEKAAREFSYTSEEAATILRKAKYKLSKKNNARFLLFGLTGYRQFQEEVEAKRKIIIKEYIQKQLKADQELYLLDAKLNSTMDKINFDCTMLNQKQKADTCTDNSCSSARLKSITLDDLELSNRSYNALRRAHIENLHGIIQLKYNDLTSMKNLGQRSIIEIVSKVRSYVPEWSPEGLPEKIILP